MSSIEEDDFVIRIRPTHIDGEWTGELDISIISQAGNDLNDEGYSQVMHFCKMMCASVPLMEIDEKLRNLIHSYVMEVVDKEDDTMIDDDDIIVTKEDGNVVHLSFGSKTKGSA
jgi:hypothetical protein|tara:strand:+ start:1042 stop:1383 length:342 start_codon:yes stop_codon:yes gene_type:complete